MEFDRLVTEHRDAVYSQMVRVCGNYDDAEDVLVEALIRAHRFSHQLQDKGRFRAWLAQIGRRICIRLRNREKLQKLLATAELDVELMSDGDPSPQEIVEAEELKNCVLKAVEEMPETYRGVYELRDMEGLSGEETAQKLGLTLEAMKTRLHRARAWIRERIESSLQY